MASDHLLPYILISLAGLVSVRSVSPAANVNSTQSGNATIVAVAHSANSSHCSLQRSHPEQLVQSAKEAQSRFKTAQANLQKAKVDLKEKSENPMRLKGQRERLEDVVSSSKDEVITQSSQVAAQRKTLQALEHRMELKQSTIASLRKQLAEKQASIEIRRDRLVRRQRDIEAKREDLHALKNSIGGIDTWRVDREQKELERQIEEYDAEERQLQWDEATARDRSAQLRSASNHWQEGEALIDDAGMRLRHAEEALANRQRILSSQEAQLRELELSLAAQLKENRELQAELDVTSWEFEASAHSVIARQGSAIGALKSYAKDLSEKSSEQQGKLAKAALENAKQDAAIQGELAEGIKKDLVNNDLKAQIEGQKAALKQAERDAIAVEGQKGALHTEDAKQAVEVHRLRGESATKQAVLKHLEAEAAGVRDRVLSAQKEAIAQQARGKQAWSDMSRSAARTEVAKDELHRAEAGNAYAHDALARRDYVMQKQNEELWRQEAAIDHAHGENDAKQGWQRELRNDAAKNDRITRILEDATDRRDQVIKMQADEIKKQRQEIENSNKLSASKDTHLAGLRGEDAKRDQNIRSLQAALDSQEDSLAALDETLEATNKELEACEGKGTPDHLADKLGDFVDAMRKSRSH